MTIKYSFFHNGLFQLPVLFTLLVVSDVVSAPRIDAALIFSDTLHDFGAVVTRSRLTHRFRFAARCNATDTLRIVKTSSPCGCTIGTMRSNVFVNNDTGSLEVTYTTDLAEGPFLRTFELQTNCIRDSTVVLKLRGIVDRGVVLVPPVVNLDDAQVGSAWKCTVRVVWKRPEPFRFISVRAPDYLTIKNPAREKNDTASWKLEISLTKKARAGYHQDSAVVLMSGDLWPEIKIPIHGALRDEVTAVPSSLSVTVPAVGSVSTNSILIVSSLPIRKVVSSLCLDPSISVGDAERIDEKRFRLPVIVANMPGGIAAKSSVIISVDAGKKYILTVPISVVP